MARQDPSRPRLSRRQFTQLVGVGGAASLFGARAGAWRGVPALDATASGEAFWVSVKEQFVLRDGLAVMNAANLCPSPASVLQAVYENTRDIDQDPSPQNRAKMGEAKERARRVIAEYLGATPEEIIITRNTSEANNLVSSGVELGPGDEVVIHADNHPSNSTTWHEKAKRFGFTVTVVPQVNPHPGMEHYIEAFTAAMTSRTKLLAFTHMSSTVGDLFPARELCRIARERGVLSLVDGAQTFGLMDIDLADMQPDFFTGSAHKWPCGSKETGVLYVNSAAHAKIWPSIYSAYPGAVGLSRTFESFGQRDEPAIIGFEEALKLHMTLGKRRIEERSRELTRALITGLQQIDGVRLWTSTDPTLSVAVVSLQPGSLDSRKLSAALYETDRIACATRGGADRGGLRFSPHLYNTHAEVERVVAAIGRYMRSGV